MDTLVGTGDFTEISRRAKQVASSMNIIFSHEMMSFNDALKDQSAQREFAIALRDVLYGTALKSERYDRYFATLAKVGCAKWIDSDLLPVFGKQRQRHVYEADGVAGDG